MLIQIFKHTPSWVFVLFFVLLVYGYSQTRNKLVLSYRIAILPAVMILLSFYGVLSALGVGPFGLLFWLAGFGIAVWLGLILCSPHGVLYSSETKLFYVPGSWLPLALMMVIFFTKYAVGVVLARHIAIAKTDVFSSLIGFIYGFFSGMFLSRALVVWRAKKHQTDTLDILTNLRSV